jgi:lipopolysaccharide transport system permease protein
MESPARRSHPGLKHLNLFRTVKNLWKYRDLILLLTQRNILLRYKGTFLGFFWMIVTPILMLAVYLFVFAYIFHARWAGPEFAHSKAALALIMFSGIIIFNIFSEITNTSAVSVAGNPNYVKKTIFPLEVLPLANVLSVCFFGCVWVVILMIGIFLFLHIGSAAMLALPAVLLCLFLFCGGIAWFMAAVGVYVRDIIYVVGVMTQLLFFATPICYSLEMVPERFRPFMYLNPLTVLISSVHKILFFAQWPDWTLLGLVGLASLIVFQGGYYFFMRTKGWFADVL